MIEKYEGLADVAKKLKALDNEVKLKILSLLIEEGSKSITDISKELNINFSTAHKYLEQLESAKLVTSKQVAYNRLKRLFFVNDFSIDLSPTGIAMLLEGKSATRKLERGIFKLFNEKGEIVDFDEKLFAQKYLKRGLPRALIASGVAAVRKQAFDGITVAGLHKLFRRHLLMRVSNITNVLREVDKVESRQRKYENILMLTHPDAVQQHRDGDIFIQNLGEPKLLNFVHDLYGLSVHGATGKKPKTLKDLFDLFLKVTDMMATSSYRSHLLESFNYFIAPLASTLSSSELYRQLEDFLIKLNNLNYRIFISLDVGFTKYLEELYSYYEWAIGKPEPLIKYQNTAKKITLEILKIMKKNKLNNINPIIKFWEKFDDSLIRDVNEAFIVNMQSKWQTSNASYIGESARLDASWKNWPRTIRIGEMQYIIINLPRLAVKTKSEKQFFNELKNIIKLDMEYLFNMAELAIGEFLRKHETELKSTLRGRWKYLHIDDCAYSISITALNETVKILSGKNLTENIKLGEKILKVCDQTIKENNKTQHFRIQLKVETNPFIAKRFYALDSQQFKLKDIKAYSPGVSCNNIKISAALQRYLLGGHCIKVDKKEIKKLFETNFGLAKLEENA